MKSGSLWNYYRDKVHDNASGGKWFKYKTKIIGKTETRPARPPEQPLNTEVAIPLKYLEILEISLFAFD